MFLTKGFTYLFLERGEKEGEREEEKHQCVVASYTPPTGDLACVVSRTRAENQMETCGVQIDGTLFLPAQERTPRVPVKAAKGSRAKRSQASSFIGARSKQATKAEVAVISA